MSTNTSRVTLFLSALLATVPSIASAQAATDIPSLFNFFLDILNNYVVPTIFAVAFVVFILGVYRYFIYRGGNEERVAEGRKFVMWSMIGFVIMFSLWGLINLFTNTLGFTSSTRPDLPTFSGATNSNEYSNTGTEAFSSSGSGSIYTGSTLTPGQTVTSNGTTYTATGPNTFGPVNNTCPTGYSLSGSQCVQGSANNGAGLGNGTVPVNGTCQSSADCSGSLECNINTHTCQADNGLGQQGDACKANSDCQGTYVCDENSMTCQDPNAAGVSAIGEGQGNVKQGGTCNSSADCSGSLECNINTHTCQPSNGLGEQGDTCSSNNDCDGSLICDTNSMTCQLPDAAGTSEAQSNGS